MSFMRVCQPSPHVFFFFCCTIKVCGKMHSVKLGPSKQLFSLTRCVSRVRDTDHKFFFFFSRALCLYPGLNHFFFDIDGQIESGDCTTVATQPRQLHYYEQFIK